MSAFVAPVSSGMTDSRFVPARKIATMTSDAATSRASGMRGGRALEHPCGLLGGRAGNRQTDADLEAIRRAQVVGGH